MKKIVSKSLVAGLMATMMTLPSLNVPMFNAKAADSAADNVLVWRYLDDNTDPANGNTDRTIWTTEKYDDSAWKTATGTFGSKRGSANYDSTHIADNILAGCDGLNDTPAYFFRTTFEVTDLAKYNTLSGTLIYDDGVVVYINGEKVAAGYDAACDESGNSLGKNFDANLQYGGSNQGPETLNIKLDDLSMLHEGSNTVAVEVHNGRKTSSDVWFSLDDLMLSYEAPKAAEQSSISLSVGADQSKMNFTWYSDQKGGDKLIVAEKSELVDGAMPEKAQVVEASVVTANKAGYYSCQATATELKAGKEYAYQLVNRDTKSEIMTFTTTAEGAYSFAFAGDPQIGAGNVTTDTQGWEKTLNNIMKDENFEGVDFILSAGDQVNTANNETQYNGYLEHDALKKLPVATVVGNHDSGSDSYDQHFNVPNQSEYGATAAGSDYYFVYNNTLFLVINSNNRSAAEHKEFMEKAIEATKDLDISWKVVTFHHSIYTVASHAEDTDILQRRQELVPIIDELDIDVVLMGHDHVYCRTYMMDKFTPMTDESVYDDSSFSSVTDPEGTLYVTANSASGSKFYALKNTQYEYSAVLSQEKIPNISKVMVSDDQFTITTYRTNDMSVVDTFTINKTVEPVDVVLEENAKTVAAKDEFTLESNVADVTWISSDEEVASVDEAGKVTAHRYGTATITATSNKNESKDSCEMTVLYSDVAGSGVKDDDNYQYYFNPVYWAAEEKITVGYDGVYFGVGEECTREAAIIFLWRLNGSEQPQKDARRYFNDVTYGKNSATNKAIAWGYENGIVKGYSDGSFGMSKSVTRTEAIIMMYRAAGKPEVKGTVKFSDCQNLSVNSDSYKAILWASKKKLTNGYEDGTFGTKLSCLREQMITFLYRFNKLQ